MTAYLIFDLIIVAVLIVFAALGARRGLILSLCGLVAVLVAFVGAGILARTLSPMVADFLEPRFAQAIEEQLNESIQHTTYISDQGGVVTLPEEVPLSGVLDVLREMGFYETLIDSIDQAVKAGMTEAAASAAAQVAAAIAESAAYLILFLVGFALILLLWRLISHALDLVSRLPGLHFLNKSLGAVFGLVEAVVFLFVAAWLLQFLGILIPQEGVEKTYLLKFFMSSNPFALLDSLL